MVHVRPDRAAHSLALLTLLAWATDWGRCESLRVCVRVDVDGWTRVRLERIMLEKPFLYGLRDWPSIIRSSLTRVLHRNAELPVLGSLVATLMTRCRLGGPSCQRVELRHSGGVRIGARKKPRLLPRPSACLR